MTYEIGEMVRIMAGPFTDFSGVIQDVDEEKSKLKALVDILFSVQHRIHKTDRFVDFLNFLINALLGELKDHESNAEYNSPNVF